LVTAGIGLAAMAWAADPWLPEAVEQGLTQQLAERLTPLEVRSPAGAAAEAVAGVRQVLEAWGEAGVRAHAPSFTGFEVPAASSPILGTMASYHVCNLALFVELAGPEPSTDRARRRRASVGLTAVSMAVLRLRQPLLAGGGSAADIEVLLAGPEMEPILDRLQAEPELLAATLRTCDALLDELAGPPKR